MFSCLIRISFFTMLAFCTQVQTAENTNSPATSLSLNFIFEEVAFLGADIPVGLTPFGQRNIIPITGGTFEGPALKGKIIPGGWDWQLTTGAGCSKLEADYMIQTDDGVVINVVNIGQFCKTSTTTEEPFLTTPRFEVPVGKYDWLNSGAYVGTVQGTMEEGVRAVRIKIYQVTQ